MAYPKGSRILGFKLLSDEGKFFYTCMDQVTDFTSYTDPETGDYFDPYYDVGNGTFTDIG